MKMNIMREYGKSGIKSGGIETLTSLFVIALISFLVGCSESSTTPSLPSGDINDTPQISAYSGFWEGTLISYKDGGIGNANLIVEEDGDAYLFYSKSFGDFIQYYVTKGLITDDKYSPHVVYSDNASNPYTPGLIFYIRSTTFQFNLSVTEKDNISGTYTKDNDTETFNDYGDVRLFYQDISSEPFPTSVHTNNYEIVCGNDYLCYVYVDIVIDSEGNLSGSYLTKDFYTNFTPPGSGDYVTITGKATRLSSFLYDIDIQFGNILLSGKGISIDGVLKFITVEENDGTRAIALID